MPDTPSPSEAVHETVHLKPNELLNYTSSLATFLAQQAEAHAKRKRIGADIAKLQTQYNAAERHSVMADSNIENIKHAVEARGGSYSALLKAAKAYLEIMQPLMQQVVESGEALSEVAPPRAKPGRKPRATAESSVEVAKPGVGPSDEPDDEAQPPLLDYIEQTAAAAKAAAEEQAAIAAAAVTASVTVETEISAPVEAKAPAAPKPSAKDADGDEKARVKAIFFSPPKTEVAAVSTSDTDPEGGLDFEIAVEPAAGAEAVVSEPKIVEAKVSEQPAAATKQVAAPAVVVEAKAAPVEVAGPTSVDLPKMPVPVLRARRIPVAAEAEIHTPVATTAASADRTHNGSGQTAKAAVASSEAQMQEAVDGLDLDF
jgi:hypothetical protein